MKNNLEKHVPGTDPKPGKGNDNKGHNGKGQSGIKTKPGRTSSAY